MKQKNENIYLIGFMGVGKTTVAKELCNLLHCPLIDTDRLIESEQHLSIPELFEQKGEAYFRLCETECIKSLSEKNAQIISCGGGICKQKENVALMKQTGEIVLLVAEPETILMHLQGNDNRPLLKGKKNVCDISQLMQERMPSYQEAATMVISTDGKEPIDIAREIAEKVCSSRSKNI